MHLFWGTFENTTTASRKQGIATEHQTSGANVPVISDMPSRVARDIQHTELSFDKQLL